MYMLRHKSLYIAIILLFVVIIGIITTELLATTPNKPQNDVQSIAVP